MRNDKRVARGTMQTVSMLAPEAAEKLRRFHMRHRFQECGCLLRYGYRGPRDETPPIVPQATFARSAVYKATPEGGTYSHHAQLAAFGGRYFVGFSNGRCDELAGGQRLMLSWSNDGTAWSPPDCIVDEDKDSPISHTFAGLYAGPDALYVLDRYDETTPDPSAVGMRRVETRNTRIDVHTMDGEGHCRKVQTLAGPVRRIFEGPRALACGDLMCVAGLAEGAGVLRWVGGDIREQPSVTAITPPDDVRTSHGEGTWYETAQGTIVVFFRDEGESCRVWVSVSDDGGVTFTPPAMSDIPDSMSRLHAGRLDDGRYYLCGNAFPTLLDRMHLMLLISEDGYSFDKVYVLADDPTAQRYVGLLKCNGYQYPCGLADSGRLLIAHSVNKEDIECGMLSPEAL